jgi:hypothetical protein
LQFKGHASNSQLVTIAFLNTCNNNGHEVELLPKIPQNR